MIVSSKLFLMVVAVLLAISLGCSGDDDKGTGGTAKIPGELTDQEYLLFKNVFDYAEPTMTERIRDLLDLYKAVVAHKSGTTAKLAALDPVYHFDTDYWYVEHTDTTEYGIEISHDSIKFFHSSGDPVQVPDSALLTEIEGGTYWILIDTTTAKDAAIPADGDTLAEVYLTMKMTGDPGEIAGAGDVVVSVWPSFGGLQPALGGQCEGSGGFTAIGDKLSMNLTNDDCPSSGEMFYIGTASITCPAPLPSYSERWTVNETFNNGNVALHVENDTHYWDDDGYCMWYLNY